MICLCQVWDLSETSGSIDATLLSRQPAPDQGRVLLRTVNFHPWGEPSFRSDHQALTVDGAGTVHRRLLQGGAMVLEGLDLNGVPAGRYELICLPLKLSCDDGTPCRALLRCY